MIDWLESFFWLLLLASGVVLSFGLYVIYMGLWGGVV